MTHKPTPGTVVLIGGNLICGTMHNRKLLSGICVSSTLLGNSPFSLGCKHRRFTPAAAADAREVDRHNSLEAWLQKHPAEFAVVDLHYVCNNFYSKGGQYYTKFPGTKAADLGKGAAELTAKDLPAAKRKQLIENYADMLLKFFPAENIALIQTRKSEYFAVRNRIRQQECKSANDLFRECEKWFRERTGCRTINTLQFYYLEKKENGTQYEKEAYQDLADNVKRFVRRLHVRQRPIFRYSLDRYCRYYDNLYKKAFGAFLRTGNAIENLVYSSQPAFIQENYELLRAAERLLIPGYRDLAAALDMTLPNAALLQKLLLAMDAVLNEDYVNPEVSYALLMEHGFTVRALWKDTQAYAAKHWTDIFPEQITEVNYGYYFCRMQLELTEDNSLRSEAERIMAWMEKDDSIVLKPMAADLWGSCVSRLNFQYDTVERKSGMVFRGNLFQALPLFLDGRKVHYPPFFFQPPISADNQVVQLQLDRKLRQTLNESGTDWLVVDLYTLTAKSLYRYQGKVYCDNTNFCSKKMGAEKITLHEAFTEAEILAQLDIFADYVRSRYGDRVILIKHKRMTHYIDFQGKVCRFSDEPFRDSIERNPYNTLYSDYFAQKSGCYYIDIVDQFLSDEMNLLYLNTVHYENAFYDEVRKLMRHIMLTQPSQRHFTDYSSLTRVTRIAALRQNHADPAVLQALFCRDWLDDAMLQLEPQFLSDHAAEFAMLRDAKYPDLQAALAQYPGSEEIRNALSRLG